MIAVYVVRVAPVVCLVAAMAGGAPPPEEAKAAPTHHMIQASDVVWGPGPAALPPGGKAAVLSGDPSQAGPFTLRAQMPAGYRIPPHWHPTDENVTVLSGTLAMGTGDKVDESTLHDLKPGGFVTMSANQHHFAVARTEVVIQVHAMGPFAVTYVNPADDPRTRK